MSKGYAAKEVAERLGVSEDTILREIREGNLIASKVRGAWRILEEDVKAYLEARSNVKRGAARA